MRAEQIAERLSNHFANELGFAPSMVSKAEWMRFDLPHGWRFGWLPPLRVNDSTNGQIIVLFSPELLDEITADLDEDDLDSYLMIIEMYIDLHQANPDAQGDEIRDMVESQLFENAPFALTLWIETDARALDKGIIPTAPPGSA